MLSTPGNNLYEYAIIRYVSDVERGEFLNVGMVMMCKRRQWIRMETSLPHDRLAVMRCPHSEEEIECQLGGLRRAAARDLSAGPMADLPVEERFRWIAAAKSACIQASAPHPGITSDLDATFDRLFAELVV